LTKEKAMDILTLEEVLKELPEYLQDFYYSFKQEILEGH